MIYPNGCAHCGEPGLNHGRQWLPGIGWHAWTPPTDAQRLDRMQARRRARTTPKDGR